MKKAEVLLYCKEKSLEGWMTHFMILDIYDDNEDIPEEIIDLVCHKPTPIEPFILCGSQFMFDELNKALAEYEIYLVHSDIKNEINKNPCN